MPPTPPQYHPSHSGYWLLGIGTVGFAFAIALALSASLLVPSNVPGAEGYGLLAVCSVFPCLVGLVLIIVGLVTLSQMRRRSDRAPMSRPKGRLRIIGLLISILGLLLISIPFFLSFIDQANFNGALLLMATASITSILALLISIGERIRAHAPSDPPSAGFFLSIAGVIISSCLVFTLFQLQSNYQTGVANNTIAQPISLADSSPSQLDVQISLDDYEGDDSYPLISLRFTRNGTPVRFVSGEMVTCNGVTLESGSKAYTASAYTASIKRASHYDCLFLRSGHASHITIKAIAPTLQSPQSGAKVPRTSSFLITFATDPAGTYKVSGLLIVSPPNSAAQQHPLGTIPDTGSFTLDVSTLPAGDARLSLTRDYSLDLMTTDFHSVSGENSVESSSVAFTFI